MLKNGGGICPRINATGRALGWTSPRKRGRARIWVLPPVGFAFVSGPSFHLFKLGQQQTLVVDLVDMSRSEIHQRLMRAVAMVSLDTASQITGSGAR